MTSVEPATAMDALLQTVRMLPPELIREVADFAEFLGRKRLESLGPSVDDELTEEDLRNHRIASMRRFEEEHGDENWGVEYGAQGANACTPPVT